MDNICGIYDRRTVAEKSMVELLSAGLEQSQISLVMTEAGRKKLMIVGRDETAEASKGAVAGAALGGTFAAIFAGAVAIGSVVVPGTTLFVAGPLVAALSGAAAGVVAGGLIGALIEAGMPEAEARKYESDIKQGKVLMVVHPETEHQATVARAVILDNGVLTAAA